MSTHSPTHELIPILEMVSRPPAQLNKFKLFPKFPLELRLKIWRHSFPASRTVTLCLGSDPGHSYQASTTVKLSSFIPNLITLRVCQESRYETLKHYKIMFEGLINGPVYFNPDRDIVSLGSLHPWCDGSSFKATEILHPRIFRNVKRLDLGQFCYNEYTIKIVQGITTPSDTKHIAQYFRGLDEVLLTPCSIIGIDGNSPFIMGPFKDIEKCRDDFRQIFIREKEACPECKIPKFMIRKYVGL